MAVFELPLLLWKSAEKPVPRVGVAGGVSQERLYTGGRVLDATYVTTKCETAGSCIAGAFCVTRKRTSPDCRVRDARGVVHERVITQERVASAEVTVLSTNRSRLRRKHKAGEHKRGEK